MNQSISIRTGFQPITHNINFDKEKIRKGKDLAQNNVKRVEELHAIGSCKIIRTSCVRSLTFSKPPYTVNLELNDSRTVTHCSCSCVSGRAGKCKHIYALIHYVNTDRSKSKTTQEQGWDRPSALQLGKDIYAKPLVLAEKFKPNENFCDMEPYKLTLEDLENIDCPLRNVMKVENMKKDDLIARSNAKVEKVKAKEQQDKCDVRDCVMILLEKSPRECDVIKNYSCEIEPSVKDFFETRIKVSHQTVFEICVDTLSQSESKLWFDIRNIRISASSRAHRIKTRTRKLSTDLAHDFLKTSVKISSPSLEYGKKHEKRAVREYVEQYNKVVRHVGVFIMPVQPWICGSPDGIVLEENGTLKILEIKCPSSCKYKPILDTKTNSVNVGYITLKNGIPQLKDGSEYYTQCQMLMYITGLQECDLYVWSPKGSLLVLVARDNEFLKKNVPKIEEFYFTVFLPKLVNSYNNNVNNNNSVNA